MNIIKYTRLMLVLLALSLCCCIFLASCNTPEAESDVCTSHVDDNADGVCDIEGCGAAVELSANADYTINLSHYDGTPIAEVVILYVYRGDESVHMKRITESTYTFNLPRDNYTFELDTYGEYVYETKEAVLTAIDTTADVTLYTALSNPQQISVECVPHRDADEDGKCERCAEDVDGEGYIRAEGISLGASLVSLYKGERNYFIFTPTDGGIYKFYTTTEGCVIGNYGMPLIVWSNSISEVVNNSFTSEVNYTSIGSGEGGTLQMVIGIDTDTAENAVIIIERISDPHVEIGFTDMPIDPVANKYTDLLNNEFIDIDVTKAVTVVYNENDGYYHYGYADGPVVFIKITASGNKYLTDFEFPSFETVISTGRLCANFYEDGTIVRRESYNSMIEEYAKLTGSRGLVPLDKSLANAIKNAGEYMGWWSSNSIFADNRINPDSAWLFACAYLSEDAFGFKSAPIELAPSDGAAYAVKVDENGVVYMTVKCEAGKSATLSFKNANGVTISVNGTEYIPDADGYVDVTITGTAEVVVESEKAVEINFSSSIE